MGSPPLSTKQSHPRCIALYDLCLVDCFRRACGARRDKFTISERRIWLGRTHLLLPSHSAALSGTFHFPLFHLSELLFIYPSRRSQILFFVTHPSGHSTNIPLPSSIPFFLFLIFRLYHISSHIRTLAHVFFVSQFPLNTPCGFLGSSEKLRFYLPKPRSHF